MSPEDKTSDNTDHLVTTFVEITRLVFSVPPSDRRRLIESLRIFFSGTAAGGEPT